MSDAVAKIETPPAPAVMGESAALISMIERAARDPNVDVGKMERLFEMSERVEARRAEQAFNAAMAAAQAKIKPVARNKSNTQTHSKYADLAALADAIDPIIRECGLAVVASEFKSERPEHLGIRCTVKHAGGHSESYEFNVPWDGAGLKGNANKTATHAYGSTLSYGRRYAKLCVFDVATMDDDGNGASKQAPPKASTIDDIKALIAETDADLGWICNHYSVETLDDLTGKQAESCKAGLIARKRANQKAAKA